MVIGKTESKKAKPRPTFSLAHPPQNKIVREVWRLVWLALGVQVIASLLSFSPADPSWSTWSSTAKFKNWVGRAGSIQADLLLQLFGLPAFALGFLLLRLAFRKVGNYGDNSKRVVLIPGAFLLSLCAVAQTALPSAWIPWKLANGGGVTGQLIQSGLVYALGAPGAVTASALLLLASTILLFEWPVLSALVNALRETADDFKAWWMEFKEKQKTQKTTPPKMAMAAVPGLAALPAPRTERVVSPSKKAEGEEDESPLIIESGLDGAVKDLPDFVSFEVKKPKSAPPPPKPVSRDPNRKYELPPVSLLSKKNAKNAKPIDRAWFLEKGQILVEKLKDFGVEGEIVNISPGPVITVYEFKPASGVKIKDIANLSDDLTLALSVMSVRIVAPIPGKPVVGIEIPSPEQQIVYFRDLIEETPFYEPKIRIPILLGRLASGEPVVADLASMPHLLVAGATGTGKSVFINALISSLLYRYTPNDLRLILVDPKMVELSNYEGIPHLLLPVVVDSKKAVMALRWAVDEMERRYSILHGAGERHIHAYNDRLLNDPPEVKEGETAPETLPFIVVIIDEYADLMAVVQKEVEILITRLAQKARASGIHLVLATQRPSTDVVTGLIKANFPSRLSFRVASSIDSKTILDRTGAERLLGNGDMLLQSAGFTMLRRMQGSFISDDDTNKVVDFLKSQGEPLYDERILQRIENEEMGLEEGSSDGEESSGRLYDQAVRLVVEKGEASISLIQRHLKIGYNRAATLIEEMEKEGVVGPSSGAGKRRPVLVGQI